MRSLVELWAKGDTTDARLVLIGQSTPMENLRNAVAGLLSEQNANSAASRLIVVCVEDDGERDAIAEGIERLARATNQDITVTGGQWGIWAKAILDGATTGHIHVLIGKHAKQIDKKIHEALLKNRTRAVFLWPLAAYSSADVPAGAFQVALENLAARSTDARCYLLVEMLSVMSSEPSSELATGAVALLDDQILQAMTLICGNPGALSTHDSLRQAGELAAQYALRHVALRHNEPLDSVALQAAIFPTPSLPPVTQRRLWVEGETDQRLFEFAASLVIFEGSHGASLLDGIIIEAFHGCARIEDALRRCRSQKDLELFLFDNDDDGRQALAKVKAQGFNGLTLDESSVMSAYSRDWVLEDLISIDSVDRFYQMNPGIYPTREEIVYRGTRVGRRLIIGGDEKVPLVQWLANNATISDLSGVIAQIILIRRAFSLAPVGSGIVTSQPDRSGKRPQPWWFVLG